MDLKIEFTDKQLEAYDRLTDDSTVDIGYGGAAFSGKSWLGCAWIFTQALANPNTSFLIGRRELSSLKKTTLLTFFKILKEYGVPESILEINNQTNIINFMNGSKIFLMDLAHKPSDPEYLRFGGLELAHAFIDEANECDKKAIDIIKTRLGRSGREHGLHPKILCTFNPSKNWVYARYYLPYKKDEQPDTTVFIPALPKDNPHTTKEYIELLENSDEITRQRLLYGNFDYDDDDRALVTYEKIQDIFTNEHVESGKRYISADIAMQGRDNFVVTNWDGLRCEFTVVKSKTTPKEVEIHIKKQIAINKTQRSNCIVDSDGLGAYVSDYVKNVKEFHGGGTAKDKSYKNLKAECAYKLAELINKGQIVVTNPEKQIMVDGKNTTIRDALSEELSQLKVDNINKDEQKKQLISKDEMKRNIGRSPDLLDAMLMRMFFEINKSSFQVRTG